MNKNNYTTKKMILCGLFTALIVVGAFIKIPVPVVPFTLQFLFTMLAGLFLGGKLGSTSVLIYIVLGLIGIPVFAQGGGPSYILKPTFGYIIGFYIATYVTGTIANKDSKPSLKRLLTANFIGLAIVYICGMIYNYTLCNYVIATPISIWTVFLYGFLLYVPGDIFLCILCAFLGKKLIPRIHRETN